MILVVYGKYPKGGGSLHQNVIQVFLDVWKIPPVSRIVTVPRLVHLWFSAWISQNIGIIMSLDAIITKGSPWVTTYLRLVPAQHINFFYTCFHLSALQKCSLLFSTNFQFIFIFKKCTTQFSHWIVSCIVSLQKYCTDFYQICAQFCSSWIIDFFHKCKKLFYCSRELSLFWTNK